MVRKTIFLALFLLAGAALFNSCKKEELSSKKEILSFIFEASRNAQLEKNNLADIKETSISAEVPFALDISRLTPSIEISPQATVSPKSGILTDFSGPVVYTVTAEDGTTKTFTVVTSTAPAPYIGSWTSSSIDFGLGVVRVNAAITPEGQITVEFVKIMDAEKDPNSFKGSFEPVSRADTEIKVEQTHRWVNNTWHTEPAYHTIMYHVVTPQSLKLYYCFCFPRQDWWFQVNMTRQ